MNAFEGDLELTGPGNGRDRSAVDAPNTIAGPFVP